MSSTRPPVRSALRRPSPMRMRWPSTPDRLRRSGPGRDDGSVTWFVVGRAPGLDDVIDGGPDALAGLVAEEAGHQQGVVVGIPVTHGGNDRQRYRVLVKGTTGRGSSNSPASALTGMLGDLRGAADRAAGE